MFAKQDSDQAQGISMDFEQRVERFFQKNQDKDGLAVIEELKRIREKSAFRVCVAGGFSRGKTRLINSLLDTKLFPEDVLPTTTMLTEISYGTEPTLIRWSKQRDEAYTLTHDNLARFSADGAQADSLGVLKVQLDKALLQPDIFLYDTPGVDDVLEQRANVTFKALEHCDAALITVSSLAPLSLHEQAFIETYLCNRTIARIALVLTFVDKLDNAEQERQLKFIINKARSLYPQIEIWCAHEIEKKENLENIVIGVEAMRQRLQQWRTMPDLQEFRMRRVFSVLLKALRNGLVRQQALFTNLQGDLEARRMVLNKAYEALAEQNETWNSVREQFLKKAELASEDISVSIDGLAKKLVQSAQQEDIEQFAASLRPRLQQATAEFTAFVESRVNNDIADLKNTLRATFAIEIVEDFEDFMFTATEEYLNKVVPQERSENLFGKIFEFVLKILTQVAYPPVVFANVFIEYMQAHNVQTKREQMTSLLIEFCQGLKGGLRTAMQAKYQEIVEKVRQRQRTWLEEQKEHLSQIHNLEEIKQEQEALAQSIAEGDKLFASLVNAME